ncbi:MAG TPA: glutamine synthetase family protein [Fimbriimonadaceae bacterium]|nr:glutamine synthetase family protein [Fimbriimonadaceae bacterium]HRJ33562.1 glutamine synthetase family protein [Fimbriimonadaceae bacterium]
MPESPLKSFFALSYDRLEEMNLQAKGRQLAGESDESVREFYLKWLRDELTVKAVTVCFTDIEGRLHMLDYDKKFLLRNYDNLTFDGSSVRGFSQVMESDLRLEVDWASFRWLPSDVFGPGKVIAFGLVRDRDGASYPSDFRAKLKDYSQALARQGRVANIAVECEGFLFKGLQAEQNYNSREGFELADGGGYYHSLPRDVLKVFIDTLAEAQRAMAFENEKDHPEVAPSQFELNYSYTEALVAADQVQLYKLTSRQVAANMGMTASFLPKPIMGINGSGMHTNISISENGVNLFWDENGVEKLSATGWDFTDRILSSANDFCLIYNSSVNAYRRLDPHFEAPNQIKSSAVDRTSMVRIPLGNKNSARMEVRTVAPDANPYLTFYTLLRTGLEGPKTQMTSDERKTRTEYLPSNMYDAIHHFVSSDFVREILGADVQEKFAERKRAAADRCPLSYGSIVKTAEILFHHEVTNQFLWQKF